jgi:hypothetical protein
MAHSPQEPTRALAYQSAVALLSGLPAPARLALLLQVLEQGEPEVCAMMMQRLRAELAGSYEAAGGSRELEGVVVSAAACWLAPGAKHGWQGSVNEFTARANAISTAVNLVRMVAMRHRQRPERLPALPGVQELVGAAGPEVLRAWVRSVCSLEQLKAAATAAQQQLQADGQEGQESGAAADTWLAVCRVWEVCCWLEELAAA